MASITQATDTHSDDCGADPQLDQTLLSIYIYFQFHEISPQNNTKSYSGTYILHLSFLIDAPYIASAQTIYQQQPHNDLLPLADTL
jgi:hypothetical protein